MSLNLTMLVVMGVLYAVGVYMLLERSLTRVLLGSQTAEVLARSTLPVLVIR